MSHALTVGLHRRSSMAVIWDARKKRLAVHWRQALPLRIMTMSYESLLADFEREARPMIAFLGLEWEPGFLNFRETKRPIRTASRAQVRQPLYQRSKL